MPEGPEIIITTQYLKTKIRKKKILSVDIIGGRYTHQKLKGIDLLGSDSYPLIVEEIDSKGKFLWMRMKDSQDNDIYMLNTFGLTGRWTFEEDKSARIVITIQSNTDSKKHYKLYFVDARNFGTIEFSYNQLDVQKKLDRLAPDILKGELRDNDIIHLIENYNKRTRKDKNLVKVLMDQEAIVSGIGNYLVAEILYDAKLNPHRSLDDLSDEEIHTLAHSIRKIAKEAYYNNGSGYMEYYESFMSTHSQRIDDGVFPNYHPDIESKKSFKFKVYQQKHDPLGNKVQNDEIVKDRTIHWVKNIQK
jgi:formamidopyrimidine-DNA glycosylase